MSKTNKVIRFSISIFDWFRNIISNNKLWEYSNNEERRNLFIQEKIEITEKIFFFEFQIYNFKEVSYFTIVSRWSCIIRVGKMILYSISKI